MSLTNRLAALLLAALLALPATAVPVRAQDTLTAAAVVNDEVISMLDLAMRLRLALLSSGVQQGSETANRLRPQVLQALIDERLQTQEAERLEIEVSDAEVEQAISQLARQNKMTDQQFAELLRRNSILPSVLVDQVRAGLSWQKVIRARYGGEIAVSQEEVDAEIARQEAAAGETELRVGEILLAGEPGTDRRQLMGLADQLIGQMRQGVSFTALARQFSQAPTATIGGDMGWLRPEQLPFEVAEALGRAQPGQVVGPIQTLDGVYIVYLHDRRTVGGGAASVDLHQLFFPLPNAASEVQAVTERAQAAVAQYGNCDTADADAKRLGGPGSGRLGRIALKDLPGNLRDLVSGLEVGKPSQPVPLNGGLSVLLVCEKSGGGQIDRQAIEQRLTEAKVRLLARRYMRNLRRSANVDLRV